MPTDNPYIRYGFAENPSQRVFKPDSSAKFSDIPGDHTMVARIPIINKM